jgi:peptidoglycan-associated lipoprotein
MFKIFHYLIIGFLLLVSACGSAKKASTPTAVVTPKPVPFITWDKKMVELGDVKKGEKRTTFFEFTNTSGTDIQIDIVDACECTTVEFPRGIIMPGKKGRLDVAFDSKDKDAAETIGINVVFKNTDASGNPRIEVVNYHYNLLK